MDLPDLLDVNARLAVQLDSGSTLLRRRLHLHSGSNITLTLADDPTNEEVDLTVALTSDAQSAQYLPGDIIWSGAATRAGSLPCDGVAVSRATYAALFTAIGTAYGAGDGSTTFNVPDYRDNFPVGAGTTYARGATGGANEVQLATNELPSHDHGLNSHTHGLNSHTHSLSSHTHTHGHTHTGPSHNHTPNAVASFIADGGGTGLAVGDLGFGSVNVQTVALTSNSGTGNTGGVSVANSSTPSDNTSGTAAGNTAAASGQTATTGSNGDHENRPPYLALNAFIKT